jgi:hypothetical protein
MTRSVWLSAAAALSVLSGTPAAVAQASPAPTHAPDVSLPLDGALVTGWNATALQFLSPATFVSTRILAMTHLAIYDSLIAITHDGQPYAVSIDAPHDTSAAAAVAAAAHRVLVNQVPAQAASYDAAYAAALAAIPDGLAKTNGLALGEFIATQILALRSGDVLGPAAYSQPAAPGVWQPVGDGYNTPAVATTWPNLTPFVLRRTSQFRAPRPPALSSRLYAANVNLVKSLGAKFSTTRTQDQTDAALFWYENGQIHFNALAREQSAAHGFTLVQAARLFALLNVALADGAMAVFDTKYAYNFWRPIAAIRGAAGDGNVATEPDPAWDSLLPLAAGHPDYISQHAVIAAAAATVLGAFFGDRTSFTLTTGSGIANGVPPRSYRRFSEAAVENAASRVWLGWHFPISAGLGLIMGREVATFVLEHALRPARDDRHGRFQ